MQDQDSDCNWVEYLRRKRNTMKSGTIPEIDLILIVTFVVSYTATLLILKFKVMG